MKALAEQIGELDEVEIYGRVVGVRGLMVEAAGPGAAPVSVPICGSGWANNTAPLASVTRITGTAVVRLSKSRTPLYNRRPSGPLIRSRAKLAYDTVTDLQLPAQFGELATVPDAPRAPPRALEMVAILVQGHEAVARTARGIFPVAEKASDEPTADLLTQRLTVHEQTAWMLRSLLEE